MLVIMYTLVQCFKNFSTKYNKFSKFTKRKKKGKSEKTTCLKIVLKTKKQKLAFFSRKRDSKKFFCRLMPNFGFLSVFHQHVLDSLYMAAMKSMVNGDIRMVIPKSKDMSICLSV